VRLAVRLGLRSGAPLVGANLLEVILPLLRNLALARLLAPEQLGLVFSLTIVSSIIEVSCDFGLPVYAVRAPGKRLSDETLKTLHSLALIRSMIVGLIIMVISPAVAYMFGVPEFTWAYAALGLISFLRGFENLGVKEAMRDYVFWREAAVLGGGQLSAVAATVAGATISPTFTCMLWGMLSGAVATVALTHLLSPRRYRLGWEAHAASDAIAFGRPLVLHGTAITVSMSDRLLVGTILGPAPLALYSIAYGVALLPRGVLGKFLTTVLVPLFVRLRESNRPAELLLNSWALGLSWLSFLYGFVLCLVGDKAIELIFGPKYEPSRAFMCIAGLNVFVKLMLVLPVPRAYERGDTRLISFGSVLSALSIIPGGLLLLLWKNLELFLLAVTLTELICSCVYIIRAMRDEAMNRLWVSLLIIFPAAVLCGLMAISFARPEMSFGEWMLTGAVALAVSGLFYSVMVYRLVTGIQDLTK
jgi:O-antigen/teichoic acid export membrane protein